MTGVVAPKDEPTPPVPTPSDQQPFRGSGSEIPAEARQRGIWNRRKRRIRRRENVRLLGGFLRFLRFLRFQNDNACGVRGLACEKRPIMQFCYSSDEEWRLPSAI
jgi:hypothetical protein